MSVITEKNKWENIASANLRGWNG